MPIVLLRRCRVLCVFTLAATLAACEARSIVAPIPLPEIQLQERTPVGARRELDVLFMIDNSGSMAQEQDNLRRNFPVFVNELKKIEGGLPDLHMAIVSSDVGAGAFEILGNEACSKSGGDRGQFLAKANCGLVEGAQFIKSYNLGTQNNFKSQTSLEEVFSCMALLGTQGCGFEHQLQSVAVALSDFNPGNAGFLRPDAYLAIIMITDEDDCSAEPTSDLFVDQNFAQTQAGSLRCNLVGHVCNGSPPLAAPFQTPFEDCAPSPDGGGRLIPVQKFIDHVRRLKRDPDSQILVSAITGQPTAAGAPYGFAMVDMFGQSMLDVLPICSAQGGTAAPALRVEQFVRGFGKNGTLESICSNDFSGALSRIGEALRKIIGAACLDGGLIDVDPETAGLQVDCSVEDQITLPNGQGVQSLAMPGCGSGVPTPCWRVLAPGAAGNTCQGKFSIDVDRGGREAAPNTIQKISCRGCAKADDPRCL